MNSLVKLKTVTAFVFNQCMYADVNFILLDPTDKFVRRKLRKTRQHGDKIHENLKALIKAVRENQHAGPRHAAPIERFPWQFQIQPKGLEVGGAVPHQGEGQGQEAQADVGRR
eukprot:5774335-Amphidinium_carterae.1